MDLHRIATRVAARFTRAAEPEALGGFHSVLKGLRGVQNQGQHLVDLVGGTELGGAELKKVEQLVSEFTAKWSPSVHDMSNEASDLVRAVGDAVVRGRRTKVRG